jgi:hypothetical protein
LVEAILEASRSATVAVVAEVVAVLYSYGSFVVDVYGIYLNPDQNTKNDIANPY